MKTVIGIDVGGSTTKIVGFKYSDKGRELVSPFCVKATDPLTSIYGAFGRFTLENGLKLSDINKVMITGGGASYMSRSIYSLDCTPVPEFDSIGLGGLYLSGLDEAIVVAWARVQLSFMREIRMTVYIPSISEVQASAAERL